MAARSQRVGPGPVEVYERLEAADAGVPSAGAPDYDGAPVPASSHSIQAGLPSRRPRASDQWVRRP